MSKSDDKLLEELFSLWKEYTKRKDIFLSIKESKIKKDFSLHLDQIKEILQEFNIDLKTLFRIFFHYHKDETNHINFLKNYKKTLFYHYKKAYKKFKNILSLIDEKGIDYILNNLEKLPEDYKKIIKTLSERDIRTLE
ncbi:hypothetical protein DRN69_07300 [Candidatus Pacearchaeota archaeon]|nr:MAG: hypothetical protein DRN69_07300 [Candidatus Pacearchaeota archaeon]